MNNKTVLLAAVLAVATVLAAGLTVFPSTVQEAQANPCSNNLQGDTVEGGDSQGGGGGDLTQNQPQNCDFNGYFEFEE